MEMESPFKTKGRTNDSKTYKTTNKGGPTWRDVAYRVTAGARSGYIINIADATNINCDEEHRLDEGRPRDLVIVLIQVLGT